MPLPPGTTRAAIAIGVDRTGLAPLAAAAKGAIEMEQWFSGEGYHVTTLTDANEGKVTFSAVFDAVASALATDTLTTLVIYFAGHGFFSVGSEIWLLSGAPANPSEAINLGESTVAARSCKLTNVVFIADTCRSVPQTLASNAVRGGSIFPMQQTGSETQIDTFYATNPGDIAVEIATDAARTSYDGLFTKVLRDLHATAPAAEIVKLTVGGQDIAVLPNRKLRRLLPPYFISKARAAGAVISQTPSLRIESDEPFYVASAKVAAAVAGRGEADDFKFQPFSLGGGKGKGMAEAARNLIASAHIPPPPLIRAPDQDPDEIRLADEARALRAADRDDGFETQCGVLIDGTSIVEGVCVGGPWGAVDDSGTPGNKFRVHSAERDWGPAKKSGSAVLRFTDGTGTILAVIPGFTASLVFRDGGVIAVNYAPAPGSPGWGPYQYFKAEAAERRAIAATTARHGILALDRDDAKKFADQVRIGKAYDPTLGIYAALAYANVGLSKNVTSVLHYMQRDLRANIFDVWLLAGADPREQTAWPVVPLCPMLSEGWNYLRPRGVAVPDVLFGATRHQSLWTTFRPEAMDAIMLAAHKGELG